MKRSIECYNISKYSSKFWLIMLVTFEQSRFSQKTPYDTYAN
jgi:hypothetical protein